MLILSSTRYSVYLSPLERISCTDVDPSPIQSKLTQDVTKRIQDYAPYTVTASTFCRGLSSERNFKNFGPAATMESSAITSKHLPRQTTMAAADRQTYNSVKSLSSNLGSMGMPSVSSSPASMDCSASSHPASNTLSSLLGAQVQNLAHRVETCARVPSCMLLNRVAI